MISQSGARDNIRMRDRHSGHREELTADSTNDLLQNGTDFRRSSAMTPSFPRANHNQFVTHQQARIVFQFSDHVCKTPKLDQDLSVEPVPFTKSCVLPRTISRNTIFRNLHSNTTTPPIDGLMMFIGCIICGFSI